MLKRCGSLIILCTLISGCGPAAVGSVAAGSAALMYDQRNLKTMRQDREITHQLIENYRTNPILASGTHINVSTVNHSTLLTGQTSTPQQRAEAEKVAKANSDIKHLYNRIEVASPTSIKQRAIDSWTTAKVKTALTSQEGLRATQIKTTTENNTVYLMGLVTQAQAKIASDITRRVEGVERVVQLTETP